MAVRLLFVPSRCPMRFFIARWASGVLLSSFATGVGHPARYATRGSGLPFEPYCSSSDLTPLSDFQSLAAHVGHPVRSVSDVRSTDARSRKRDRPEGIAHGFQVILYKVEPRLCVTACNLLTKEDSRAALANEVVPGRPKMPLVSKPSSFTCRAERLAGARACPDLAVVTPAGAPQGVAPDSDAGEEMALPIRS